MMISLKNVVNYLGLILLGLISLAIIQGCNDFRETRFWVAATTANSGMFLHVKPDTVTISHFNIENTCDTLVWEHYKCPITSYDNKAIKFECLMANINSVEFRSSTDILYGRMDLDRDTSKLVFTKNENEDDLRLELKERFGPIDFTEDFGLGNQTLNRHLADIIDRQERYISMIKTKSTLEEIDSVSFQYFAKNKEEFIKSNLNIEYDSSICWRSLEKLDKFIVGPRFAYPVYNKLMDSEQIYKEFVLGGLHDTINPKFYHSKNLSFDGYKMTYRLTIGEVIISYNEMIINIFAKYQ